MSQFDSRQVVIVPTYLPLLDRVTVNHEVLQQSENTALKILANIKRYQFVEQLTGVPAMFIGALHHLECGGMFNKHLANGDLIHQPTINEPVGIPAGSWEECAIAALKLKGWTIDAGLDWELKLLWLWRAEKWNGWGYRMYHPETPSPYLWSGTSESRLGKYVSDGNWDADAVSAQVGCVAIWMALGVELRSKTMSEKPLNLETIAVADLVIGVLKINTKTWIKSSTQMAKDLAPADKYQAYPDQMIPIYQRLPDKSGHYNVMVKAAGVLKSVFCYSDHAGIEMRDEANPDDVGAVESADKPAIAVGDKKAIQKELIRVGLLDPIADGKFGAISQSAWRAFTRIIGCESEDLSQAAVDRLVTFKSFKDLDFKPEDPNDEESLLAVKCVKRMVELGAHVAISMGSDKPTYNIFHVTGTNPDGTKNSNKINQWNDLRFVVEVSQSGLVIVKLCKLAACEPGQYWIDNPMNSGGTFRIRFDRQWFAWSVGRHGSRQYPALVQVGEIEGYRDSDRNGSWSGEKLMSGDYMGINIHHGYGSATVDIMSAGCQVAQSIAGHEEFMRLCKSDRRYVCNNGYRFGNISLNGSKI